MLLYLGIAVITILWYKDVFPDSSRPVVLLLGLMWPLPLTFLVLNGLSKFWRT